MLSTYKIYLTHNNKIKQVINTFFFLLDLIEVPGGGKSLRTIQTLTKPSGSGTAKPSTSGISRPKIVNLTGGKIKIECEQTADYIHSSQFKLWRG